MTLVDLLVQELEERCQLYREHRGKEEEFLEFFEAQKIGLYSSLRSRFGISIAGEERCTVLREKYQQIFSANRAPASKPPIGF